MSVLRKPIVIISLIIAAGGFGVWYAYFREGEESLYEFAVAERKNIVQEVSVTGRVKPSESVELSFEKAGQVVQVLYGVGKVVRAGAVVVRLDSSELAAKLLEAEAALNFQQAKLDKLLRGARPEEIRVQEAKVANKQAALEDSKRNLLDKIRDSFTKADDAIRNKSDQFFINPISSNPQLNFTFSDSKLESDIESERLALGSVLNSWNSSLATLETSSDFFTHALSAQANLRRTASFLDKEAVVLSVLTPGASITQATIDSYRADVSTARTNINTALSNLSSAEKDLRSAEALLAVEERQLELDLAGATEEEKSAQEAEVEKAEAGAQNIRVQIEKSIIRAPFGGVVTRQDAKVGQIVSANTAVVSLISEAQFEIEAFVPEADIAKLRIGNPAKVTLDAYRNDFIFEAKVVSIDPAETVIEGVPTYKTVLRFLRSDEKIRPGMTANTDILADMREGALVIPQRAVINRGSERLVRIMDGDSFSEIKVLTGLRGTEGNIEILDGLKEGDRVITFIKEE